MGALLYDSLLLLGVWMVSLLLVRPLSDAETIPALWVQLIVLTETAGYLFYSWMRSGQTLGMRAWRLKLVDLNGSPVGFPSCVMRFVVAPVSLVVLGLGYLWVLGGKRQTWHDLASRTYVVRLPDESD